jgi:hypothetical protein
MAKPIMTTRLRILLYELLEAQQGQSTRPHKTTKMMPTCRLFSLSTMLNQT